MNIDELLPFYALDAVSAEERQYVERYLADHPEAATELADLQQGVDALWHGAEPLVPRGQIKANLMARVGDTLPVSAESAYPEHTQQDSTASTSWWPFRWALPTALAAVTAIALVWAFTLNGRLQTMQADLTTSNSTVATLESDVSALERNIAALNSEAVELTDEIENLSQSALASASEIAALQAERDGLASAESRLDAEKAALQSQIDTLTADVADLQEENFVLLETINEQDLQVLSLREANTTFEESLGQQEIALAIYRNPDIEHHRMASTGVDEDAWGQLSHDAENDQAALWVARLDQLEATQTYQLWFIGEDGVVVDGGVFAVRDDGTATVLITSAELSPFNAIGVSIEPDGGSETPSEEIVLLGEI